MDLPPVDISINSAGHVAVVLDGKPLALLQKLTIAISVDKLMPEIKVTVPNPNNQTEHVRAMLLEQEHRLLSHSLFQVTRTDE